MDQIRMHSFSIAALTNYQVNFLKKVRDCWQIWVRQSVCLFVKAVLSISIFLLYVEMSGYRQLWVGQTYKLKLWT